MPISADSEIRRHVQAELFSCPNIDETGIAVMVASGMVTLTGHVRSLLDKYCAEDAVKRVAGVAGVVNKIQVQALAPVSQMYVGSASNV